jgi:hypothetical protein
MGSGSRSVIREKSNQCLPRVLATGGMCGESAAPHKGGGAGSGRSQRFRSPWSAGQVTRSTVDMRQVIPVWLPKIGKRGSG